MLSQLQSRFSFSLSFFFKSGQTWETLLSDYRNGSCMEFQWMPLREAGIEFHFKRTRLSYYWSNSLNFPGPECCADSQRASTAQREKTCLSLTNVLLMRPCGLEDNAAFLRFCTSTSVNYGCAHTRLGDSELLLRQLGGVLSPDSARGKVKTKMGLIIPHSSIPSGGYFHWRIAFDQLARTGQSWGQRSWGQYHCDHITVTGT